MDILLEPPSHGLSVSRTRMCLVHYSTNLALVTSPRICSDMSVVVFGLEITQTRFCWAKRLHSGRCELVRVRYFLQRKDICFISTEGAGVPFSPSRHAPVNTDIASCWPSPQLLKGLEHAEARFSNPGQTTYYTL